MKAEMVSGDWLAGLTDGEGCFYLCATRKRSARGYDKLFPALTFEYRLALRADDVETVRLARALLGVGTVRVNRRGKREGGNAKPLVVLTVYARTDIPTVIAFFRRHPLLSKKAKDFALWAEAFELFQRALVSTPLTGLSKGALNRPSATKRRRPYGSQRLRFRTIPDALWKQMAEYERRIVTGRKYGEV